MVHISEQSDTYTWTRVCECLTCGATVTGGGIPMSEELCEHAVVSGARFRVTMTGVKTMEVAPPAPPEWRVVPEGA